MDRRSFLVATGGLLATSRLSAQIHCGFDPWGRQTCRAEVDFQRFLHSAYQIQQRSEWCWAACISMVFRYYGHPVSQSRIVQRVYGRTVNLPAGWGITIARQLNRDWVDDHGKPFVAELTGVLDVQQGAVTLNNATLATEMAKEHPVILGTAGHAVVMTEFSFIQPGYIATDVGVFDPWPGRGPRSLLPVETVVAPRGTLSFAATCRIKDA